MSVTTRTDDCIEKAIKNIEEARDLLLEAIHPNTWGSELRDEYKLKINNHASTLLEMYEDINK